MDEKTKDKMIKTFIISFAGGGIILAFMFHAQLERQNYRDKARQACKDLNGSLKLEKRLLKGSVSTPPALNCLVNGTNISVSHGLEKDCFNFRNSSGCWDSGI